MCWGSGIHRQFGEADLVVENDLPEGPVYRPAGPTLGTVFSIIGVLLVVLFFITSSDSGSLVMNMLTAGGTPD